MINLFLSDSGWSNRRDTELPQEREALFDELESVLWSLISSAGRSEARLWLCNVIGGIKSISPKHQRELFVKLLRAKPLKRPLAVQLLQLFFEKQPQKAGSILAKKSSMLENFFRENPRQILQWFSNFSGTGGLEHAKGAKALSQFAFVNRDICWEELEWKGKHGQSPAMVATKPHYFLDLDVQRSVENFLDYVPEFWSSREFAESLKDGEILCMDTEYFANIFVDLMYKEDCKEIWDAIDGFLLEESFLFLCQHLLILLEEKDLCYVLDLICMFLNRRSEAAAAEEYGNNPSFLLEIILVKSGGSFSLDQLLLINAVTSQARHLLRLVREEAEQDGKRKIKNIVSQISESMDCGHNNLSLIMEPDSQKKKAIECIKRLGLYSWAIYFSLSEDVQTAKSWESLFTSNRIGFKKSNKYGLLPSHDASSEESGSDSDDDARPLRRSTYEKKRRRHRKKRRRRQSFEDELLLDIDDGRLSLQSKADEWLLSTDQYSNTWSNLDLPEHISRHCFCTWMKRAFT